MNETVHEPEVLRGTRALAQFLFGDSRHWRRVYPLAAELGLFRLRGFLCGRPSTIRARIADCELQARCQGRGAGRRKHHAERCLPGVGATMQGRS